METISRFELQNRCAEQSVPGSEHYAFKCPRCGTVQSYASLVAAGVEPEKADKVLAFSCVGRFTGAGPWPQREPGPADGKGCNWTLGGLFRIHELEVDLGDGGETLPCFTIASPEEAQALRNKVANPTL